MPAGRPEGGVAAFLWHCRLCPFSVGTGTVYPRLGLYRRRPAWPPAVGSEHSVGLALLPPRQEATPTPCTPPGSLDKLLSRLPLMRLGFEVNMQLSVSRPFLPPALVPSRVPAGHAVCPGSAAQGLLSPAAFPAFIGSAGAQGAFRCWSGRHFLDFKSQGFCEVSPAGQPVSTASQPASPREGPLCTPSARGARAPRGWRGSGAGRGPYSRLGGSGGVSFWGRRPVLGVRLGCVVSSLELQDSDQACLQQVALSWEHPVCPEGRDEGAGVAAWGRGQLAP